MKDKIIVTLIIINLIFTGVIYNIINNKNVNNKKQIIKEMKEVEYEDYITEINQSHEDYAKYIEESKKKIASAITEKGVETSNEETLEAMANNIKSIPYNSGKISIPKIQVKAGYAVRSLLDNFIIDVTEYKTLDIGGISVYTNASALLYVKGNISGEVTVTGATTIDISNDSTLSFYINLDNNGGGSGYVYTASFDNVEIY